jgi:hypothetical protein
LLTCNRPSSEKVKQHCFFWDEERQKSFFNAVNIKFRKGQRNKSYDSMQGSKWTDDILPEVRDVLEGKS